MGVIYLLLCWTGIPSLVAMVETFTIVFSSQDSWAKKYNNGIITPPTHVAIKILAFLIPLLVIISIIVSILIPILVEHGS
jgi:hypothetical protein